MKWKFFRGSELPQEERRSYVVDRGQSLIFDWLREEPGLETMPKYHLFCVPVGSDLGESTRFYSDTNLQLPGRLPAPQGFLARSIHAFYGTMSGSDRERFRERYTLEFWIGHKYFYQCPLAAIPIQGLYLPHESMERPSDWPPQPGDISETPRYIPANCPMRIDLIGKPFTTEKYGYGLKFLPVLNGVLDREVQ